MCKQTNYSKYQKRVIKFLNDLLGADTPFTYERANNNHLKVLIDGVTKPLFTGSTPSDCKSINNFMAEVKRELKASKKEESKLSQPEKTGVVSAITLSNDKLIQNCVKSLRTRITVLKEQEKESVLNNKCINGLNLKRIEIVKHSVSLALQARKQGTYLKPKELRTIEGMVHNHLNFMLPSMAYYAELLNSTSKDKLAKVQPNKQQASVHNESNKNNVISLEDKTQHAPIKEAKKLAKKPKQPVSNKNMNTKNSNSATELMAMSANNRVSLLRNLTKAQALMLIDDINQAMAANREEDIEAVIALIRDKDLPLDAIISRMEAA
ncbi:hypothetical protein GNP44_02030 [Aliivibrio fischeri]|uniref:hypothetical protein n=1 Tax=Aliivibrio fischeri TaxID=668 RepID=UPI0012D9AB3F|nr:hypothetical protein [Aliivibrio fischeri]MUK28876.1 hypothetical protein [Aliivibrio fischeri]